MESVYIYDCRDRKVEYGSNQKSKQHQQRQHGEHTAVCFQSAFFVGGQAFLYPALLYFIKIFIRKV